MPKSDTIHVHCPECGATLNADVELWYKGVPLRTDGFVAFEGSLQETNITETHCSNPDCGWSEDGSHYYHTGEVVKESADNEGGEQDD
jgi:hypothetical protein